MEENNKDQIRHEEHDYDGIQEYDNPLPGWWLYLFYITIVFSFVYLSYYTAKGNALANHLNQGEALSWTKAKIALEKARADKKFEGSGPQKLSGEALVAALKDPQNISSGREAYEMNCIACHGDKGQGGVGPNLVDPYWLHGHTGKEIRKSIADGFPQLGMPSWENVLGKRKIRDLTAYVISIQGNDVTNPKAPEGEQAKIEIGSSIE